ncbi:MAG: gamma-glutamyl-gamma-aminobutyrate hydrolase family protein [Mycetocola sp.]
MTTPFAVTGSASELTSAEPVPSPTSRAPHLAILHLRTTRPHAPEFQDELNTLNAGALAAAARLGWTTQLIAVTEHPIQHSLDAARRADAVLLMGGEDVDPRHYNGPTDYPGSGSHDSAADEAHIAVVRQSLAARTPLLGICRGQQIINVALGGTLIPHLPSTDQHRGRGTRLPSDPSSTEPTPFVQSHVTLTTDSALRGDIDPAVPVYCTHHQAVDRLGDGLQIDAVAPDGVVEAISHVSAPITAVQWHPEHPDDIDGLVRLLERLGRQITRSTTAADQPLAPAV